MGWGFSTWSGFIITSPFYSKPLTPDIPECTPKISFIGILKRIHCPYFEVVFLSQCMVCTVATVGFPACQSLPILSCHHSPFCCCAYKRYGELLQVQWVFVIMKSDKYAALCKHISTHPHTGFNVCTYARFVCYPFRILDSCLCMDCTAGVQGRCYTETIMPITANRVFPPEVGQSRIKGSCSY